MEIMRGLGRGAGSRGGGVAARESSALGVLEDAPISELPLQSVAPAVHIRWPPLCFQACCAWPSTCRYLGKPAEMRVCQEHLEI